MSEKTVKILKDVFKDYKIESSISNVEIKNINLFKKLNRLRIELVSNKYIKIEDIYNFEKFLKTRFSIEDSEVNIKYGKDVEIPSVEENWKYIVAYFSNKYPLTRAILKKSKPLLIENTLEISLSVIGSEILLTRKFDKLLEEVILGLFNKKIKVKYVDNVSSKELKEIEERKLNEEKKMIREASIHAQENTVSRGPSKEVATKKERRKRDNSTYFW